VKNSLKLIPWGQPTGQPQTHTSQNDWMSYTIYSTKINTLTSESCSENECCSVTQNTDSHQLIRWYKPVKVSSVNPHHGKLWGEKTNPPL